MARIIDIVRARRNAIEVNPTEAQRTGDLAIAALLAGIRTSAWQAYMEHFPGLDAAQLNRLTAEDGTLGNPELDKRRAYLVANGTCGINSPDTTMLAVRVNSIDAGLAACDPE
jgi:hypothetical protein